MAEVPKTASVPSSTSGPRSGSGFELRLERGGAFVRLADVPVLDGLTLDLLDLAVPDVRFPFDVGAGSGQFRHRLSDLDELAVSAGPALAEAALARAGPAALGLEDLRVALRQGFAEIAGRLAGGATFTIRAGLVARGERGVAVALHGARLYGPAQVPAGALVHTGRRVLERLGEDALPEDPLSRLLRRILAPRGWKIPRTAGVRLARAEIEPGGARLAWSRDAGPVAISADAELLAAVEGERTFRDAEALLARGETDAAREAYLSLGAVAAAHPFAAERLLGLLAVDDRFHDEALDLAAGWLGRRPGFAPALAAEAGIRISRGEPARAAKALAALAASAAERGEAFGALLAAEAAFALPGADPADARSAAETALSVRRDHVPALRALRDLATASGDREAVVRSSRRLVAYDPDDAQKARAHAQLGELLLVSDPPAARLHLDQALRLAPDDADTLASLARACEAAGEHLRAVRALDRLRELRLARGDRAGAAEAALRAGILWDERLDHPENALLRLREACELAPSAESHARAASAAARAGEWAEAADHHQAVLASLRGTPGEHDLAIRTRVALAEIAEKRLSDPAAAVVHLEAAAALAPERTDVLRRLAGLARQLGRTAALAAALDRLAPLAADAGERAAALAEAGEASLALGRVADARGRFTAALAADDRCRPALEGLARLAASRGDGAAERDALLRLVPLAPPGEETAALHDRLSIACERAGDLGGALRSANAARIAAPSPARLEAALRLVRLAGDSQATAALLAERARSAAAQGDAPAAAEAWLERARLLAPNDPVQALSALSEARLAVPGDPSVLRAQAEFAERAGDPRLALGALRALLAQSPADSGELEVRAGKAALDAGEPSAAREHAEKALARTAPGAGDLLADILDRTGDETGRADLLERIGRPLEAALLHEKAGDAARARAALERAAQRPETAGEALRRLAEMRLADGDRAGAATALLTLARKTPGRDGARLALRAFEVGADPAALDAAASSDPTFAPPRARRAERRAAADPRAALADAEAALSGEGLAPEERPALLALAAHAAEAAGDEAAALRHLSAWSELAPADAAALGRLAALQRRAGRSAELVRTLSRLVTVATGAEAVAARLDLSDLLVPADLPRATRLAEEALALDPGSTRALAALAHAPRGAGAPPAERAERLGRLAARADLPAPDKAAAHAARARLLADLGDRAGALEAARAAAAHGVEGDEALKLRADLAARAGDRAEEARARLALAARASQAGDPLAAEMLAEAALQARAAGLAEAGPALHEALAAGPERETSRALLEAVRELAREAGDAEAERQALGQLIPLLPTGARPAALLRLSTLALGAGDVELARSSAEEARTLAPRDPAAARAARAAAEADGDLVAVGERLADLAALEPAAAGTHLLERARLLARLADAEGADEAYREALAALPPDRRLAEEHALLRRANGRPAPFEPLERFALRTPGPGGPGALEAARALRAAASLALEAGDWDAALRCARRASARTRDDLGFAGPLLARILWLRGSAAEATVLHRRLLDAPEGVLEPEDAAQVAWQLSELALDAGDRDLALTALDRYLALRPHDSDAASIRFELDDDRHRAVERLAEAAERCRSLRRRALALERAGEAALLELDDRPLADRLLRRARHEADAEPRLAVEIARRRATVIRDALGVGSDAFLDALEEAAGAAQAAGDRAGARALYAEVAALLRERGQLAASARQLLQLGALAAADGDFAASAAHAREAGTALRDAGDLAGAQDVLARVVAADPADAEAFALLEDVVRARGPEGAAGLIELLSAAADHAAHGGDRAAALVRLADAQSNAGDEDAAETSLRAALAESRGHPLASERLVALLDRQGRTVEQAEILLARAQVDPEARAGMRREAAARLARSADPADRARAIAVLVEDATAAPGDVLANREAAQALVSAGRRDEAVPFLHATVRADPEDEAATSLLVEALAGRPADRAAILLERAEASSGQARAERMQEAAAALDESGDAGRAREARIQAFLAAPANAAGFAAALRDASGDAEALDRVLAARAGAVPAEAAACHRARADALAAVGRQERALAAYEAALAAAPDDPGALLATASALAATRGDGAALAVDARLVARAEAGAEVPPVAEAPSRFRLGLAAGAAGDAAAAVRHLERAVFLAPSDPRAGAAWTALAEAHATRRDGAAALAAARRRADRALALGLPEERRLALEAGADLAMRFGDSGADAAEILDALLAVRAQAGGRPGDLAELARRAASALEKSGEERRARVALARAGLSPSGPLAALAAAPPAAPAVPPPAPEPAPVSPSEAEARARAAAERALATSDPGERAAAFVEYASWLSRGNAALSEIRTALELAADADPDSPDPWRARALIEAEAGEAVEAARAHLSVAIRAEGEEAAASALEAARLFAGAGRHAEAARAYRAAQHARPGSAPPGLAAAEEALAAEDPGAAADHLRTVPGEAIPAARRAAHHRRIAEALDAAGRAEDAGAAWSDAFREDPADAVAFSRAADHAYATGGADDWLEVAATHEAALGSWGDGERRRDLRYARGTVLSEAGRLEEAREAFLAALELDPEHGETREALAALDARADDWSALAGRLAREAGASGDAARSAVIHVRVGRILRERLADAAGAILSLRAAVESARESAEPAARRAREEAEALLRELGAPVESAPAVAAELPAPALAVPQAPPRSSASRGTPAPETRLTGDPVADVLRMQAEQAEGMQRAELFERLAGHLERAGDRPAAADALFLALEADPERDLTHAWLAGLVEGDAVRSARAAALRPAPAEAEASPTSAETAERTTGEFPPPAEEAPARTTGEFPPPEGETRTTGEYPPPAGELDEAAAAFVGVVPSETAPAARQIPSDTTGEFPPVEALPEGTTKTTGEYPPPTEAPTRTTGGYSPPPPEPPARTTGAFPPPGPERPSRSTGAFPPPAAPRPSAKRTTSPYPTREEEPEPQAEEPRRQTGAWPPPPRSPAAPPPLRRGGTDVEWPARSTEPPSLPEGSPPRVDRPGQAARPPPLASRPSTDTAWPPATSRPPPLEGRAERATGSWPPPQKEGQPVRAGGAPGKRSPAELGAQGRAEFAAGRLEDARALLAEAFAREPSDLTLARDLLRIAEKLGRWDDYLQLGEILAEALGTYDPLAAAARFRHFAEVARTRLHRDDRAAVLLEKSLALVPGDPGARRELLELWARRPDTAPRALAAWLEVARGDPADGQAFASVVALSAGLVPTAPRLEANRLTERGRIFASVGAFVAPGLVSAPPAVPPARTLPPGLRDRVAVAGAGGSLGRLLALLTPWLETLFPADLARRGATAADRLVPPRGAAVRSALDMAMISLGARAYAPFLTKRPGIEIAVENTQPPSLVASAGVEALPEPALNFAAARAIDLLTHGWGLVGKFAPRDVGILLELACRFAGGSPPSLGLPAQRAGAFLQALEGGVPAATRRSAAALGQAASEELAGIDPRAFAVAMRRTANRVALVHAGDPGPALGVLATLERKPQGPEPRPMDLPDVRDLADFALSEAFLDLRMSVRGQ
ncbi:MAG TPA: hypothetical protein VLU43_00490 [Anaeromyxobacteraceae bacterium]|nr:hypothetical protein [Anaeromyxobacteraceae bacterium]